ncbi:MAG: ABC transporter substrate-binding protein [Polaromonas sp.]|nr:ABC transporter substrate-binding protein [Polaromonas sp.]
MRNQFSSPMGFTAALGGAARLACYAFASAAVLLAAPGAARAQSAIVVGQSCDLSGATSARVKEYVKGVDAYLAKVNSQGGVAGRPIKLIRYDDAFNGDKGLENARRLVEQDGAMVLFGMGSAATTAAVLPYASEKRVPVFGSMSGATSLRKPQPMLIHLRASFADEVNRLASHFAVTGIKRIGVLAADLPIGKDGIAAIEAAAKVHGLTIVEIARVSGDLKDLDQAVAALAKSQPAAVLILAPAGPGIKFTEAIKKAGITAQLAGLSVMSSDSLYKALGDKVQGMVITQVVPFPWNPRTELGRDYQKLMTETSTPVSVDSVEGYVAARLLVEALKASAPKLTRESFIAGVEAMTRKDVDGMAVSFSAADRSLTRMVDITMLAKGGKLVN